MIEDDEHQGGGGKASKPPREVTTVPPKTEPRAARSDDVPTSPPKSKPEGDAPRPPQSSLPAAPKPDATAAPSEEGTSPVGTVLNENYRVDRLIGTGGMGEVYEGEHLFTGNRVAIKMILEDLSADEGIVSLFRREARILFQLADDAIVRYLDSFYHSKTNRYCLVMQFIDGVPLADRIEKQGPLPESEARALMRRIANGLGKAHSLGVTHRDLSPDNVMLREGKVERAALIDFGIATAEDMNEGTLFGRFAGKYRYVAPEQLGLFEGEISARTDVYGLALLMSAALRGEALDMGRSFPDAVKARGKVPSLKGVPKSLQPLFRRMLQPNPMDRPASMEEVIEILDGLTAAPSGPADQTVVAGATPRIVGPPVTVPGIGGTTEGLGKPAPGIVTSAPGTDGPFRLIAPPETTPPPPANQSKVSLWVGLVLLAAAIGGAGWYFAAQSTDPTAVALPPDEGSLPEDTQIVRLPPPDISTREGFLAAAVEDPCTYVTRLTAGAETGRLAVFSEDGTVPRSVPIRYGETFGLTPDTTPRPVSGAQCAALDLMRGLQGRGATSPTLVLDADELGAGDTVLGRVGRTRARGVWLALVTSDGAVFDLSDRLEPQADGSFLFAFTLSGGTAGEPQLMLALASADPLVAAATAPDGANAETFLPRLLAEASEKGAAGQIARFVLTQ